MKSIVNDMIKNVSEIELENHPQESDSDCIYYYNFWYKNTTGTLKIYYDKVNDEIRSVNLLTDQNHHESLLTNTRLKKLAKLILEKEKVVL